MIHWRPQVGALSVLALAIGTASAFAAPATADPAADPATGNIIGWADGAETASYPGPFAQLGDNGLGANAVGAIRADGSVAIPAALQASAQAVPASVSSQRTVSLSIGGPRSIWAASADGSLTKWGGSRGSFADQTWTPEQLGGKAVAVTGGVYSAFVIVETPDGARHATFAAYGVDAITGVDGLHPVVSGGTAEPVTDLVALGALARDSTGSAPLNALALRSDGSLVDLDEAPGWTEVRPAGDDPVVAFSSQPGTPGTRVGGIGSFVTQSGKSYGFRLRMPNEGEGSSWVLETWQDDNFPGVPAGESVKEINATGDTSTGSPQFLLTDQGNVVAWTSEPQAGGGEATPVPLPASMAAGGVLDIADGAYALVEAEAAPALAVTSEPTIAGTAQVSKTLTGTPAGFNDASAVVTNQWKADGVAISGATGTTLALTAALQGKAITFESTATRGTDTLSSTSGATAPVAPAPLAATAIPTISGTVQVGKVLTGKPATFNGTATVKNQWKVNGVAVTGATGTTITLPASFQGRSVTFVSTATRGSETVVSSSVARGPVAAAPIVRGYPKPPTLTFNVRPTSKKAGRATVVVARATTARPVPTGTIRVTLTKAGSRKVVAGTLSAGRRVVVLPKLAKGTWRVQVSYLGDRYYLPRNSGIYSLKITR